MPEIFAEATSIFQKVRFEPNEIEYKQPLSSVKPPWKIQVYKCMIVSLGQCHFGTESTHLKGVVSPTSHIHIHIQYTHTYVSIYVYISIYIYISSQVPWTSQVSSSLMTNVSEDVFLGGQICNPGVGPLNPFVLDYTLEYTYPNWCRISFINFALSTSPLPSWKTTRSPCPKPSQHNDWKRGSPLRQWHIPTLRTPEWPGTAMP